MTGRLMAALGAAAIGAGAICAPHGGALAQAGGGGACDRELLAKIDGHYVGQNLGFRSTLEVAGHQPDACRIEARWETLNEHAPVSKGTIDLTLEDGVLKGEWRSGEQAGRARFDVLRNGRLLNGRMIGLKDEPSGSWDYSKAP